VNLFSAVGTVPALLGSMMSLKYLRAIVYAVWSLNITLAVMLIFQVSCIPAEAQWVGPVPESADEGEDRVEEVPVMLLMDEPEPVVSPEATILAGELLLEPDLAGIDDEELRYLRNTVFARHGYDFGNKLLAEHFGAKSWYAMDPEYTPERLTLVDQENIQILLKAEGDWEAAHTQGQVVMVQQSHEASKSAGSLEILDAYLTDKAAVADGTAPEGFELPALDYYKEVGVKHPLTAKE
jgi:hypothetical protein